MGRKRIKMDIVKEILRLMNEGYSQRKIAVLLNTPRRTIRTYLKEFRQKNISWPLEEKYIDNPNELMGLLSPQVLSRTKEQNHDFFLKIHQDLTARKGLKLYGLWEELIKTKEYKYSYSMLARSYKKWAKEKEVQVDMRQVYQGGEMLHVDFSGDKVPIYNPNNLDEILYYAEIFVGTLPASNFIFCQGTVNQKSESFCEVLVSCFKKIGGVPQLIKPDNLKSAVIKANRFNPVINQNLQRLARFFGTEVYPARAYKPQDKANVEKSVQMVQQKILVKLHQTKYTNIKDLNQAIAPLMDEMNDAKFQKLDTTRTELFNEVDKPHLKPLPKQEFEYKELKIIRVRDDHHIEFDKHYYSVPYPLVKKELTVWTSSTQIDCYYNGVLVCSHQRSLEIGGTSTRQEHRPKKHQIYLQENKNDLVKEAVTLGAAIAQIIEASFNQGVHEKITSRKVRGFLNKIKKNSKEVVAIIDKICQEAIDKEIIQIDSVDVLMDKKLSKPSPIHENIRGNYN